MKISFLIFPLLIFLSCKSTQPISETVQTPLAPPIFFYETNIETTSLSGNITEQGNEDPVIYGSIALFKNGQLITGAETDFDGNYLFPNLDAGIYDMEISYVGFESRKIAGILIAENCHTIMNVEIANRLNLEDVIIINCSFPPIIEQDDFTKGQIFISTDIRRSPTSKNN